MKKSWKILSSVALVGILVLVVILILQPTDTVAGRGGGKGGGGKGGGEPKCCDPAAQPGVGGNPFCFEGASCCTSGNWQCNNADGSPSCDLGTVCTE